MGRRIRVISRPGRLKELLVVGCKLWVRYVKSNPKRKTNYSTVFVEHKEQLISLISTLPNAFVKESLITNTLPIYKKYSLIKPEVAVHNHRIDFLLERSKWISFLFGSQIGYLCKKGVAKFPDAVTRRGFTFKIASRTSISRISSRSSFCLSTSRCIFFSTNVGKRSTFFICFGRSIC